MATLVAARDNLAFTHDYQLKSLLPFPAGFNFSGLRVIVGGGRGRAKQGWPARRRRRDVAPLIPLNIKLNLPTRTR